MNRLKRSALAIALIAIVSLIGSASAESLTVDATMPRVLSIDFPSSVSFGQLNTNGPTTLDYQSLHITANCMWSLSVYPEDNMYGHHGYLTQQNYPNDYIRTPVSIGFPYGWPYTPTTSLESYYSYNPYWITSSSGGDYYLNYQLSTQAAGTENSDSPYSMTITFVLNGY